MKIWTLFLSTMLCSGVCIASGLSGCGDDDPMSCRAAVGQVVNYEYCKNEALASVDIYKTCVENCQDEQECDQCADDLLDAVPSCLPGILILVDDGDGRARCGDCYIGCWDVFDDCVELEPDTSGTECWTRMVDCIDACP